LVLSLCASFCVFFFLFFFFFFNDPAPSDIYTLSLHDALPILLAVDRRQDEPVAGELGWVAVDVDICRVGDVVALAFEEMYERQRSEEHTSELQSPYDLVCRLLLEKKKKKKKKKKTENNKRKHT